MDSHKLSLKLFADGLSSVPNEAFVPIFHGWIREKLLPDHLLIDVADYAHVPEGPGTVLVAHEANVHLDRERNQPGVLYVRKQPAGATFEERLRTVLHNVLRAAQLLEDEAALGGKVDFSAKRMVFRIHDRLLAPNTTETFTAVRADLERVLMTVLGPPVKLTHTPDPDRLFEVTIDAANAPDVKSLLLAQV